MMTRVLIIAGTRPEAIKLCPVAETLRSRPRRFAVKVCATGQHRNLADEAFAAFDVNPDYRLDVMTPGQSLFGSTAKILAGLESVLDTVRPGVVLVQGDTTTTLCGALAAFYAGIPVGHVEAGLRTFDITQPFPEEMNRVLSSRLATLHFCPTEKSAGNLRREHVSPESIHVTGNTGIDAVLDIARKLEAGSLVAPAPLARQDGKRMILVTAHRRESFGAGFERICQALDILSRRDGIEIVYPAHPNPNVQAPVRSFLRINSRIRIIEPLDYVSFVDLMRKAHFLITDSGGIQEEGPSLGKPILVLREKTERPEAVEAGTVKLVGTSVERIVTEASTLLDDSSRYEEMARRHNPYGDGLASERIAAILESRFG